MDHQEKEHNEKHNGRIWLYRPGISLPEELSLPCQMLLEKLRQLIFENETGKGEELAWQYLNRKLLLIYDAGAEEKGKERNAYLTKKNKEVDHIIFGNYLICTWEKDPLSQEDEMQIRRKLDKIRFYRKIKEG